VIIQHCGLGAATHATVQLQRSRVFRRTRRTRAAGSEAHDGGPSLDVNGPRLRQREYQPIAQTAREHAQSADDQQRRRYSEQHGREIGDCAAGCSGWRAVARCRSYAARDTLVGTKCLGSKRVASNLVVVLASTVPFRLTISR